MKKLAGFKSFRGIDLHVVHEQGMVSSGRYNTDFDPVIRVPVQELIIHKHLEETNADYSTDSYNLYYGYIKFMLGCGVYRT